VNRLDFQFRVEYGLAWIWLVLGLHGYRASPSYFDNYLLVTARTFVDKPSRPTNFLPISQEECDETRNWGAYNCARMPYTCALLMRVVRLLLSHLYSPWPQIKSPMVTALPRRMRFTQCSNVECRTRTHGPDLSAVIKYLSLQRAKGKIDDEQFYELSRYVASLMIEREVECLVTSKVDQAISQKFSPQKLLEALALA
jgi:hypothetical protein